MVFLGIFENLAVLVNVSIQAHWAEVHFFVKLVSIVVVIYPKYTPHICINLILFKPIYRVYNMYNRCFIEVNADKSSVHVV